MRRPCRLLVILYGGPKTSWQGFFFFSTSMIGTPEGITFKATFNSPKMNPSRIDTYIVEDPGLGYPAEAALKEEIPPNSYYVTDFVYLNDKPGFSLDEDLRNSEGCMIQIPFPPDYDPKKIPLADRTLLLENHAKASIRFLNAACGKMLPRVAYPPPKLCSKARIRVHDYVEREFAPQGEYRAFLQRFRGLLTFVFVTFLRNITHASISVDSDALSIAVQNSLRHDDKHVFLNNLYLVRRFDLLDQFQRPMHYILGVVMNFICVKMGVWTDWYAHFLFHNHQQCKQERSELSALFETCVGEYLGTSLSCTRTIQRWARFFQFDFHGVYYFCAKPNYNPFLKQKWFGYTDEFNKLVEESILHFKIAHEKRVAHQHKRTALAEDILVDEILPSMQRDAQGNIAGNGDDDDDWPHSSYADKAMGDAVDRDMADYASVFSTEGGRIFEAMNAPSVMIRGRVYDLAEIFSAQESLRQQAELPHAPTQKAKAGKLAARQRKAGKPVTSFHPVMDPSEPPPPPKTKKSVIHSGLLKDYPNVLVRVMNRIKKMPAVWENAYIGMNRSRHHARLYDPRSDADVIALMHGYEAKVKSYLEYTWKGVDTPTTLLRRRRILAKWQRANPMREAITKILAVSGVELFRFVELCARGVYDPELEQRVSMQPQGLFTKMRDLWFSTQEKFRNLDPHSVLYDELDASSVPHSPDPQKVKEAIVRNRRPAISVGLSVAASLVGVAAFGPPGLLAGLATGAVAVPIEVTARSVTRTSAELSSALQHQFSLSGIWSQIREKVVEAFRTFATTTLLPQFVIECFIHFLVLYFFFRLVRALMPRIVRTTLFSFVSTIFPFISEKFLAGLFDVTYVPEPDKVPDLEHQGLFSTLEASDLLEFFTRVTFPKFSIPSGSFRVFMETVPKFFRFAQAAEWLVTRAHRFFAWIMSTVFKLPFPVSATEHQAEHLAHEAEDLIALSTAQGGVTSMFRSHPPTVERARALHEGTRALANVLISKDKPFHPIMAERFRFAQTKALEFYKALESYRKEMKRRVLPVWISITGNPGIGKTAATKPLMSKIKEIMFDHGHGERWFGPFTTSDEYELQQAERFFDAYANQPFLTIDDLFQNKMQEERASLALTILNYMSPSACPVLTATPEKKGEKFLVSEFFLTTGNVDYPRNLSIESEQAVLERRTLCVRAEKHSCTNPLGRPKKCCAEKCQFVDGLEYHVLKRVMLDRKSPPVTLKINGYERAYLSAAELAAVAVRIYEYNMSIDKKEIKLPDVDIVSIDYTHPRVNMTYRSENLQKFESTIAMEKQADDVDDEPETPLRRRSETPPPIFGSLFDESPIDDPVEELVGKTQLKKSNEDAEAAAATIHSYNKSAAERSSIDIEVSRQREHTFDELDPSFFERRRYLAKDSMFTSQVNYVAFSTQFFNAGGWILPEKVLCADDAKYAEGLKMIEKYSFLTNYGHTALGDAINKAISLRTEITEGRRFFKDPLLHSAASALTCDFSSWRSFSEPDAMRTYLVSRGYMTREDAQSLSDTRCRLLLFRVRVGTLIGGLLAVTGLAAAAFLVTSLVCSFAKYMFGYDEPSETQSGQFKTRSVRPRPSARPRAPTRSVTVNLAKTQPQSEQTVLTGFEHSLLRNIYKFEFKKCAMYALAIGGKVLMLPLHALFPDGFDPDNLPFNDDEEIHIGTDGMTSAWSVRIGDCNIDIPDDNSNVIFVWIPVLPDRQVIVQHFRDEAVQNVPVTRMCPEFVQSNGKFYATVTREHSDTFERRSQSVLDADIAVYDMPNQRGICGLPYYVERTRSGDHVIGIHASGSPTHRLCGVASVMRTTVKNAYDHGKQLDIEFCGRPSLITERQDVMDMVVQCTVPATACTKHIGQLNTHFRLQDKSKLVPTTLHPHYEMRDKNGPIGMNWPPTRRPARLMPEGDAKPLAYAQRKYSEIKGCPNNGTVFPLEWVESYDVRQFLPRTFNAFAAQRVLTYEEAVLGTDGVECLDLTKSTGFPFAAQGKTRRELLFHSDGSLNQEFKQLVLQLETDLDQGIKPMVVVDALKDELVANADWEEGKVRRFCISELKYLILGKMYFHHFLKELHKDPTQTPSSVGINPHSAYEWGALAARLSEVGESRCLNGDFSGYEYTLHPYLTYLFCKLLDCAPLPGMLNRRRHHLVGSTFQVYHVLLSMLYEVNKGNCSGNDLTIVINALFNDVIFYCAWVSLNYPPLDYYKHVRRAFMGDDSLVSVAAGYPEYNMLYIQSFCRDHGLFYTAANKGEIQVPYIRLAECDYLKRKFVPRGTRVTAPLAWSSIMESVMWINKSSAQPIRDTIAMCESALIELTHYSQEDYEKYHAVFTRWTHAIGKPYVFKTYQESMRSFRARDALDMW